LDETRHAIYKGRQCWIRCLVRIAHIRRLAVVARCCPTVSDDEAAYRPCLPVEGYDCGTRLSASQT
jgi:hypothetical protein